MFFICIIPAFMVAIFLLKSGQEDVATLFVFLSIMILSEIFKPEKSTLKTMAWAKVNLKWICLPLLTLPTLLR